MGTSLLGGGREREMVQEGWGMPLSKLDFPHRGLKTCNSRTPAECRVTGTALVFRNRPTGMIAAKNTVQWQAQSGVKASCTSCSQLGLEYVKGGMDGAVLHFAYTSSTGTASTTQNNREAFFHLISNQNHLVLCFSNWYLSDQM